MAGSKHVTTRQLASGAAVAVRLLPCRIDVAGSEVPAIGTGCFAKQTHCSRSLDPGVYQTHFAGPPSAFSE